MGPIDHIAGSLLSGSVSQALVPINQSARSDDGSRQPSRQQQVPVTLDPGLRAGVETRAELLQNRMHAADGDSTRSRHALRAYRALEESEEREQLSKILGFDGYA
ncbi:hypothetical protein [Solemya velesiana gill symbiont]|uniref:Uncharacterized protein n=1 Tax=Solemya velesiana gill symbiont TaxID=1918948 RepID=A0A1T2KS78_9GAMM|nr:hypothetical protein [Solemya velesiana gill symbiont]OOZ35707.1 hypothetical protein BOW51_10795 [Solemya velesiana gill symbiont]